MDKNTSRFNEDFIRNYNEESDESYFFEIDIQYLEKLHELQSDLTFLPERIKIETIEKLEANFYNKLNVLHT